MTYTVNREFADLLARLLEFGILTGSRTYGTAKPDSDWDVAFPITNKSAIDDIISSFPTTPSKYNSGYSINANGESINLIPIHPHEFAAWLFATQSLASSLLLSNIDSDQAKYSIFQAIVASYRGHLQKQTIDGYIKYNAELIAKADYLYPTLMIKPARAIVVDLSPF